MRFFIDTANLDEIHQAQKYGLIDGVTTNPSLFAKEQQDWKELAAAICKAVDGPVSLEVVGLTAEEMVAEARELVKFGPNVVVKIPMIMEGLVAVRQLSQMGIDTNVTLVFSPLQALMAAKAGATYVSPFVGRVDDTGADGMELIEQIVTIFNNYNFKTQVLVASIRSPMHIVESALMGADVSTIPYKVLERLAKHPLTDKGLADFLADWKNTKGAGR
ncbi:fructose-6-phosphate aldolase [Desulfovibrio ferrophilus]|uniref:Probable transaldolase n=1 Tax=Desulfovibrio ferrophilus TaxID=241368 RepID=A0A2Z6AWR1_9BACT|nr:fructose-6-phosphate aldolase [Desulfovibrio ferrophilus]BBD07689.1 transaldolase [Desulfovibrio ferrophilus]